MTPGERSDYIIQTWLAFIKKRGSPQPTMSSNEFNLLLTWMDADVPLRVVLQALEQASGTPRTLLYFERPVEAEMQRVRQALAL